MANSDTTKLCLCGCGQPVTMKYSWRTPRFVHGHISKFKHPSQTHGMRNTRTYKSWDAMRSRCYRETDRCWDTYGGRGITVCDRWNFSFENFLADMGQRPEGKSLDRIDTNGNYDQNNCRWATPTEQANNRRSSMIFTLNGVSKCGSQWAKEAGVTWTSVRNRIRRGWPIERALTYKRSPRS